jgi:hypothetical protein
LIEDDSWLKKYKRGSLKQKRLDIYTGMGGICLPTINLYRFALLRRFLTAARVMQLHAEASKTIQATVTLGRLPQQIPSDVIGAGGTK